MRERRQSVLGDQRGGGREKEREREREKEIERGVGETERVVAKRKLDRYYVYGCVICVSRSDLLRRLLVKSDICLQL